MLRSDTLMLDNTLIPLYQERVTFTLTLTFTAEHTSEQYWLDDGDGQSLVMMGMGIGAGKQK